MMPCLFCGGDRGAPDHLLHCDGRQGGVVELEIEAGYPHEAGWTEPTTSREAAESVDAPTIRAEVLACLKTYGAMTTDECAQRLTRSVLAIRPRFSELRQLALIVDTGERRVNTSGRRAAVWGLAP